MYTKYSEERCSRHVAALIAVLLYQIAAPALGVVVNFDDLPGEYTLTGGTYAGLTWEQGNAGAEGFAGIWYTPTGAIHPQSLPRNVMNGNGATLMGIAFPGTVNMNGAYFAVQGNLGSTSVRALGYLQSDLRATTGWTGTLTGTPIWLDMSSLIDVDRIVVESLPVNAEHTAGAYGMDDLTFTYTPEPTSLALSALAGFGLLLRRRR